MNSAIPGPVAFEPHDHSDCVARAVASAEAICAERGLRLTPIRRRALEVLAAEHKALGAYDVLALMAEDGHASHPPVAYRALDFLVAHGFAHKIERMAAFVACSHPGDHHRPAFLICRSCRVVAEAHVPNGEGALGKAARALGFEVEETVIEAEGLCRACRESA
ncbi:MAG: transcriptional repressor [Pseudomonadota bacterium]